MVLVRKRQRQRNIVYPFQMNGPDPNKPKNGTSMYE